MTHKNERVGLHIGVDGFTLPTAVVGMRMPVLAEPGAGKSVFVAVLIEELWRAQLQFAAIDPLGTGWGAKASADGEHPGLALPYLGAGRYADAPLRPDGGAVVARALVDTGASMMLNVSGFGREDQNRFVADFWNELLRLGAARHDAGEALSVLNLVDEAGFFMPETPRGKEQARAQDAGERIARQGRGLGLGFCAPTQRPQGLDKDVLGMWEVMVLMRLTEPAAIRAALAQVEHVLEADVVAEIRSSLPRLKDGEAWFISPRVLKLAKRVQIRMRDTYDSTRTPVPGERRRAPRVLADVDLAGLRSAMAISEAVVTDPKKSGSRATTRRGETPRVQESDALRQRIAQLERELAERKAPIEIPVLTVADRETLMRTMAVISDGEAHLTELVRPIAAAITDVRALLARVEGSPPQSHRAIDEPAAHTETPPTAGHMVVDTTPGMPSNAHESAAIRMLLVLARCAGTLTKRQLSTLAQVSLRNGTFAKCSRALAAEGLIVDESASIRLLPAGTARIEKIAHVGFDPPSSVEIVTMYGPKLHAGERRLLDVVVAKYPTLLSKSSAAAAANLSISNGAFAKCVRVLETYGLITSSVRGVKASSTLFMATDLAAAAASEPVESMAPQPTRTAITTTSSTFGDKPLALHPASRKLLSTLAQHAPERLSWAHIALIAGLKPAGGHFNAGRKALRDAGFVQEIDELVTATATGLNAAGDIPPAPSTAVERLAVWCERLPSPAPEMLRTLAAKGEHYTDASELAAALGKKPMGGHWNSGIALLRDNGLIEVNGRQLRAAELLR